MLTHLMSQNLGSLTTGSVKDEATMPAEESEEKQVV
jgi:hypothetical protein